MPRTVIPRSKMTCLYAGRFNSFYQVQTAAGPREVAAHNENKSNLLAAKMMVICLNPDVELIQEKCPLNTLPSFLETLRRTGLCNFSTLVLAADRPVTYFEYPMDLAANHQLEFPGGVSEGDEDTLVTALRETVQEYGLDDANDIIQTAPLVTFPASNDAGTNAELYTTRLALVRKAAKPPRREGIIPEACWFGPLTEVEQFLKDQGQRGIVIEWLALATISHLCQELLGGWAHAKNMYFTPAGSL